MTAEVVALVLASVVLTAAGQLLLKVGADALRVRGHARPTGLVRHAAKQPCIAAGAACYLLSMLLWIGVLSRVEVSLAYPMLALGYAVNALGARYFLRERVGAKRLAGIAIILVGVCILARS